MLYRHQKIIVETQCATGICGLLGRFKTVKRSWSSHTAFCALWAQFIRANLRFGDEKVNHHADNQSDVGGGCKNNTSEHLCDPRFH